MTENEFRELMIETIKYSDYEHKDDLLNLMCYSYIIFDKTCKFTHKTYQCKEYILIKIFPKYKMELEKHFNCLEDVCFDIYEETTDYDIAGVFIKPGRQIESDEISQEVHFDEIQSRILEEINNAKYTIWVAVAWFTNSILFNALEIKQQEGVNVRIIINDDGINRRGGIGFEEKFETVRLNNKGYYSNIMHNKFCVIDLETVIHGSYNWTNKANYNSEDISIDTNRAIARMYADKFLELLGGRL